MLFSFALFVWNLFQITQPVAPLPTPTPFLVMTPSTIPSPSPTIKPTAKPTKNPTPIPPPANGLISAINNFRLQHGKTQIISNPLLCSIAKKRSQELVHRNSLDGHEGIQKYRGEIHKSFKEWKEVIYSSSPPKSAASVVQDGWANSAPHKDAMLSSQMTHGCGALDSGFAVFLLATK